jgi:UDP-N-acetylglucosamine diphosphorylase / glucose-1-phosphate thymidylyltransferase / UDP-N-acetylgalactosamine diphosphorylase / glucosamine-1-phosphate N-acetyltransferase / galactosamine-1-phosphate N-acetyltransferase
MKEIKHFFCIEKFSHKDIFLNTNYFWQSIVNIKDYIQKKSLKNIITKFPAKCHLENEDSIFIGEGTLIEPYSYIKGPCIIGANSQIRQGAYIRGNVITGDDCIIGHCTEIKNSILLNRVKASHFAYIGDSIIGNDVNLGAGVKLANFRLDQNEVSFFFEGQKIKTGLSKFGAIIGDGSQIGCNTVLNPATFFEKNVVCFANLNIGGFIEKNSIIKPGQKAIIKKSTIGVKNEFFSNFKK